MENRKLNSRTGFSRILAVLMVIAMLAVSFTACGSKAEEPAVSEGPKEIASLKIAFSPYADADVITESTEPLEQLLKDKLQEKGYTVGDVDMSVSTSYTAVGEALSAGSADIGFMSSANYILFSDDADVLVTALRKAINKDSLNPADWNDGTIEEYTSDLSTYYRCIVLAGPTEKGKELAAKVNAGEELTWEDVSTANWAVLEPTSSSGYIYPCLWLQDKFGKSISDLPSVMQLDSHSSLIARLAAEQADIVTSYAHIRIKNAPIWGSDLGGEGEMADATAVIGVTDGIVNDLVAYSKTSDTMADEAFRTAVGEALIEIGQTEEGKEIISVFSQVGYAWGKDSDYDVTRKADALLKELTK